VSNRENFRQDSFRHGHPLDDLSRVQYIFGSFTSRGEKSLGLTESASVFGEL